jgi:hypothetical protein
MPGDFAQPRTASVASISTTASPRFSTIRIPFARSFEAAPVGAAIVGDRFHRFSPHGVSGFVTAAIDLFTCRKIM